MPSLEKANSYVSRHWKAVAAITTMAVASVGIAIAWNWNAHNISVAAQLRKGLEKDAEYNLAVANETATSLAAEYHGCPPGKIIHQVPIAHPGGNTAVILNPRAPHSGEQPQEIREVTVTSCKVIPETTADSRDIGGSILEVGITSIEDVAGTGYAYIPATVTPKNHHRTPSL